MDDWGVCDNVLRTMHHMPYFRLWKCYIQKQCFAVLKTLFILRGLFHDIAAQIQSVIIDP